MSTQIDDGGAILAANDSDVTERATDHYSYLWTRDGAFVANALDIAGYPAINMAVLRFLQQDRVIERDIFCRNTIPTALWRPAGTLRGTSAVSGSLCRYRRMRPALVIWALWQHYDSVQGYRFCSSAVCGLDRGCAGFMADFRDLQTAAAAELESVGGPSWRSYFYLRERWLRDCRAAANFSRLFAEDEKPRLMKMRPTRSSGDARHLYSAEHGRFLRPCRLTRTTCWSDPTVDASLFGVFYFGCFAPDDPMVVNTSRLSKTICWTVWIQRARPL